MRKLELIKALRDLELPPSVVGVDRPRLPVVGFEPLAIADSAIDGWLFYRVLSPTPALVPPPLEPLRSFPEASYFGDEILLLLIKYNNIILISLSFYAQSHGYPDVYHMIIPELGRIDRSHAAARPLP